MSGGRSALSMFSMAASKTAIRDGYFRDDMGSEYYGNTSVADDSYGGIKNWWNRNVWRVGG